MMKRFLILLACLCLLAAPALAEESYPLYIDDEADLLTASEESQLSAVMSPLTAYGAAAFVSTRRAGNTDLLAESYFDSRISPSTAYSGAVFMIDMANREIYIFTRGAIEKAVGRAGAYAITDNIYRYASAGNYYQCAASAFEQVLTLTEGGRVFSPMRIICNLLRTAARPSDTLNARADVRMSLQNQRLIKSTKHRRESSSGGRIGGGGGFSGGGGGGGHGGGGSGGGHGF